MTLDGNLSRLKLASGELNPGLLCMSQVCESFFSNESFCTYLLIEGAKLARANMPHKTEIAGKPPVKPEWKMQNPQDIQR